VIGLEIEPPTNAYAFVAAQYLKQEARGAPAITPSEPATPATVMEAPTIAAAPSEGQTTNTPAETVATNTVAETTPIPAATPPAAEEPPPKRIVAREGLVRGTFSIQAPTHFELISPENGKAIDYLHTTSPSLDLSRYKGLRIIVTGEESLEERWGNTPVITIQKFRSSSDGSGQSHRRRAIAGQLRQELLERISGLRARGLQPGLALCASATIRLPRCMSAGKNRPAGNWSFILKRMSCPKPPARQNCWVYCKRLNSDPRLHGILVQAPLPSHIRSETVYSSVHPEKDVDGFHPMNVGKLMLGDPTGFLPCTPAGIRELLIRSEIKISGSEVVVLGRGNIVGNPWLRCFARKINTPMLQ